MSELRETSYQPEPEDWPVDRQVFKARILRIIGCLLKKGLMAGLPAALNEKKWRFGSSVPYPVPLKFLEKRLKTSYYRRKASLEADVMHLLTTINSESNMEDSASVLEEYNMKTQIVCHVVMESINNLNFDEEDVEMFIDGTVALLCKNRGEFEGKKRPRAASAHPEDGPGTSSAAQKPEGPAAKKSRSGRESKRTSSVHRSLGSFV
ncbi:hypothetical protein RvY_10471 [Ramazzottius varieornatus]|uniref:Bromo domain-containing protein n=1 Tax=Ramazzottius varieornatus TaxID=947166 RepID=A0A1D1VCU4_RAMVA|nr:hypothetical protein RvY_10471 [Ramazzottius varieornatus]